uniref:Uncharacterized protein n=1 Tax=Arundo donax TaxID=35708 RepID=A0A0A9ASU9_ARUDO
MPSSLACALITGWALYIAQTTEMGNMTPPCHSQVLMAVQTQMCLQQGSLP